MCSRSIAYLADPASNLRAAAFLRSRIAGLSDEALKLLAPRLAEALIGDEVPDTLPLAADDRERLRLLREGVGEWIALADQMPAADLIDRVLSSSAYAVELAGPGLAQARENLKKVRGLVRRIQNRGYATLGRTSEFFAELVAGGDESNAIIDAADAVNMMTVHAAKGLEFPVVFVVNLGKGSGGGRDPIRIVPPPFVDEEAEDTVEPSVAIGDHASDADRDADAKDYEESKRLLYVALTRARDRLYLGATATDQTVPTAKGSVGSVLPDSLLAALTRTPDRDGRVIWAGAAESHVLRRLDRPGAEPRVWRRPEGEQGRVDDFIPLSASAAVRVDNAPSFSRGRGLGFRRSSLGVDTRRALVRREVDARQWPIRIA